MSINGEQIKESRERLRMTQKDLSEAVGVSLRTITNWETGSSVPRNRLGAVKEALGLGDESEALQEARIRIGELAQRRRKELGFGGHKKFAETIGLGLNTVYRFETGSASTRPTAWVLLERALDWEPGVIVRVLEQVGRGELDPEAIDMDTVSPPPVPVSSASELSDVEVFEEAIRRMGKYRDAAVAAEVSQDVFGLAASSGHGKGDDEAEVEQD